MGRIALIFALLVPVSLWAGYTDGYQQAIKDHDIAIPIVPAEDIVLPTEEQDVVCYPVKVYDKPHKQ